MVPVDMRGIEDFQDVEQIVNKLGPKTAAKAFLKAREDFLANKEGDPEEERPKPMTAKKWKQTLMEDEAGDGEESSEESLDENDHESENDSEPEAKKPRKDTGCSGRAR